MKLSHLIAPGLARSVARWRSPTPQEPDDAAVHRRRRHQGRRQHDERLSRLARRGLRPLPRRQPGRPGRAVADQQHEDAVARKISSRWCATAASTRACRASATAKMVMDNIDQPVCVPEGPLRRRHHARPRSQRSNDSRSRRSPQLSRLRLPLAGAAAPSRPQAGDAAAQGLRVCQDPNNLPFSNAKGEGIENRSPSCSRRDLGLPVEYYSFPQRLAFIRNTLRYKLPGEDYPLRHRDGRARRLRPGVGDQALLPLDLRAGVRQGQGPGRRRARRATSSSSTRPSCDSAEHRPLRPLAGIGVARQAQAGRAGRAVPDAERRPRRSTRARSSSATWPPARSTRPSSGVRSPATSRKRVQEPELVVVPMQSEPGVKFDYQMAMGVRYGETRMEAADRRR